MLNNIPILTYEQQQQAVERIQTLRISGMSTDEAIVQVARELRANHTGERIIMHWNLEEDSDDSL